eukprot:336003-Pleurochrysis_carterae.AAC.3
MSSFSTSLASFLSQTHSLLPSTRRMTERRTRQRSVLLSICMPCLPFSPPSRPSTCATSLARPTPWLMHAAAAAFRRQLYALCARLGVHPKRLQVPPDVAAFLGLLVPEHGAFNFDLLPLAGDVEVHPGSSGGSPPSRMRRTPARLVASAFFSAYGLID